MSKPSVSVVIPTYQAADTLGLALGSLERQRYDGALDVICVDGGSDDGTRELADRYGARVVENPDRNQEEGMALGIEAAEGELLLLLDADNELPGERWLERLVSALESEPDVVSADCLYHEWRRSDPPIVRLCALIGNADPIAAELGWGDRWGYHLDRWTTMPLLEEDDRGDFLIARIDPEHPPSLGSNGFLVRRQPLMETEYRPFVHPDVIGQLAERGWRFARVRQGVSHHFAPTFAAAALKARRRARETATNVRQPRRGFRPPLGRTIALAVSSLLLVRPALHAIHGYRRKPDKAWALLPPYQLVWTLAYAIETARAALLGTRRPSRSPAARARPLLTDAPSVSVVTATFNSEELIEKALASVAAQRYDGPVEVICVDGGSHDRTREIAERMGARVVHNPLRVTEEGQGIGIERASGELVLMLDSDNELPHEDWLASMVAALESAPPDIVSADSIYHEWRRSDPAIVRLGALMGNTDPVATELGWADRWAVHLNRWTGMPLLDVDDHGDVMYVRVDPDRPPPLASNGFLVRREPLLHLQYRPYIHPDVASDLARAGWRFARLREPGTVHNFAPDFAGALRKARRRAWDSANNIRQPRYAYRPSRRRLVSITLSSLFVVGPTVRALRGFRRRPDPAWALYPIYHLAWTISYAVETIRAAIRRTRLSDSRAAPRPGSSLHGEPHDPGAR